ncbi:MAG: dTDP-4-dehydrorhamnose reductase [Gammaproteobacteria bacterium RIFCSPHIGHO2_12_FULL_38_14]|nr:MAG: dTDP-4-dehydrorhamnose reductase [Gammaproteobacteria bacterium RIFCSPHIGHO2_12_FULL_38_14]
MNNYSKILITGGNGQLSTSLIHHPMAKSFCMISCSKREMDISNPHHVQRIIEMQKPSVIINTAAYTAVDLAEDEQSSALIANRDGAKILAEQCKDFNVPLIHFSTDYVFDGEKNSPYTEEDSTHPLNFYGQSKLLGEEAIRNTWEKHIILRISGVFSEYKTNFVKTILRLASEREQLSIVDDQITCPTSTTDIATAILMILQQQLHWGTYHFCSNEAVSWHVFACALLNEAKQFKPFKVNEVIAISSEQYKTKAKRPLYSVLGCKKIENIFGINQPSWKNAIKIIIPKLLRSMP